MRCAFPSLCALRCANKFPSVTMVLALVLTLFDKRDPTGALTDRPSHLISSHHRPALSKHARASLPHLPESPDFTAPKPDTGSQREVQASSPSVLRLPTNIPSHNIQPAAFAPSSQSPEAMLCRTYRVHAFLTFARLVRLWAIWIRRVEGHVSLSRWKASLK